MVMMISMVDLMIDTNAIPHYVTTQKTNIGAIFMLDGIIMLS
jgi:hypothetical protein